MRKTKSQGRSLGDIVKEAKNLAELERLLEPSYELISLGQNTRLPDAPTFLDYLSDRWDNFLSHNEQKGISYRGASGLPTLVVELGNVRYEVHGLAHGIGHFFTPKENLKKEVKK